jgi:60 kDa SS-A/Ro ribonucleoprotein
MGGAAIAGTSLTAREAAAAMALVTLNTEANTHIIGFTSGRSGRGSGGYSSEHAVTPLAINSRMTLQKVCEYTASLPFGGTDAALPMLYAKEHKLEVDAFFIYTDNETWAGSIHPFQALDMYRQASGRPAKMVAVGLTATEHSVCDPSDAGSMNVVGFDTATPSLMADFVR